MKSSCRTLLVSLGALCLLVPALIGPVAAHAVPGEGCSNEHVRLESDTNPATGQAYSVGLPECRAYEMVSPLEKQGNGARNPDIAAPNGEAVSFKSKGNFGEAEGDSGAENFFLAYRSASGWIAKSTYFVVNGAQGAQGFSADLTAQAECSIESGATSEALPDVVCGLVNRETDTVSATPDYPTLNGEASNFETLGASSNLSTIVFQGSVAGEHRESLLPSDQNGAGIYEVTGLGSSSPVLSLVNLNNAGEELQDPESVEPRDAEPHSAHLGAQATEVAGYVSSYQAISSDGNIIYFTATPPHGVRTLFARVDGERTVAVSEPSLPDGSGCTAGHACFGATPSEGIFQGASADGRKVFFLTEQPLVNGDQDTTSDLYEAELEGAGDSAKVGRLIQVSHDPHTGEAANVQGVVRISADGSHVYFVATGVLTGAANARGEAAKAGAENMYSYDTGNGETRFVAELCSGSSISGAVADPQCPSSASVTDAELWSPGMSGEAQATPDGQYLIFDTYGRLIATGAEADTDDAKDVYRYDASTGELVRVSVGESGFSLSHNANGEGRDATINPGRHEAAADENDVGREISENGEDVLFSTSEQLQADATYSAGASTEECGTLEGKTQPGCEIYLWHNGAVSMISDGQDPTSEGEEPSMSANGSNIFFDTKTQLVGQDTDVLGDVYDARVDGGFPAPTPEASCSGEACQGSAPPAPAFGVPGTSTFTGGGANLAPPPPRHVVSPPAPLTRAQKLGKALKQCHKEKKKAKRRSCEAAARKKYGVKHRK